MKIWKSLFSAAAMVLLAAGCTEEMEPAQVGVDTSVTFTAEIAETPTKTVLDYEEKLSKWSGDEYITILNGQDNYTFKATVAEPAVEATFALADEKQWNEAEGVVAVYPMGGSYALDKANMTVSGVTVPVEQKPLEDTYDVLASVMMAYTTDKALTFKNTVSLVRFKVMEEGIWNVTIKANGGEKMTGAYDLRWNDGNPQLVAVAPAAEGDAPQKDHVALWYGGQGDSFTAGRYYYAAVAPGTYAEGFTVSMNNTEVRVTSESKTLERCRIYDLGELALPEAEAWGICGTMTNWGKEGTPDLALVAEGEWLVYKGLSMGFMDMFQFRADGEWGRQYGNGGVAKSGETYEFEGEHKSDMCVYEPGVYDVYLAKDFSSFKVEKVGELAAQKPAQQNWGVVGSMTQWGGSEGAAVADITMTVEGNLYVARNVTIYQSGGFKFRVDGSWDNPQLARPYPAEGETVNPVESGKPYAVASEGNDITVAENGVYDIFLSAYEDGFRVVKTADAVEPEPEPDPEVVVDYWAVVGTMSEWGDYAVMELDGDWHVAENVQLKATDQFKFRADGDDLWEVNRGAVAEADGVIIADNVETAVVQDGKNFSVSAGGLYTVSINKAATKVKVVRTGDLPDVPEPEPENMTVYFRPSTSWTEGSVTFVAWIWETDSEGTWYAMTDSDSDGVYEVTFPDNLDNIIFASMNGTADWANKVYQTENLVVPTDDKNAYIGYDGTWKTLAEAKAYVEPVPDPTQVRIYVNSAWGWNFGLWCWDPNDNNAQIFAGNTWPGKVYEGKETVGGVSYVYWNVPDAYVGKTVSMLVTKINGSNAEEQSADYTDVTLSESVYFDMNWTEELGVHMVRR